MLQTEKNIDGDEVNVLLSTIIIVSKIKEKKSIKRSGLKISLIILKRIKESLKVTHHREKWFWT